jgi:DNA polymerase-3 subunit delta
VNIVHSQLEVNLKKAILPIYLIGGDEPLLVEETRQLFKDLLAKQGFDDYVRLQVDNDEIWKSVANDLHTGSLFGKKIIDLRFTKSSITKLGQQVLQNYCKVNSPDKVLLLFFPKLDATIQKNDWFKAIDRIGGIVQIFPIYPNKLHSWIAKRLEACELTASNDAIELIIDYTEGNLLAAAQEIAKLKLLYNKGKLDLTQILAAIADNAKFSIFDLADMVLLGNTTKALRILHNLEQTKTEPTLVLWALSKDLRLLADMKGKLTSGANTAALMREYKIWEKRQLGFGKALQRNSIQHLNKALHDCMQIDFIIKGQKTGNVWDELENLIILVANSNQSKSAIR